MEILKEGDKKLRTKATRIASIDDTLRSICSNMVETMLSSGGIGLAGNQVGYLKRVIIVLHDNASIIMINPEILNKSESMLSSIEGCLSVPNKSVHVNRYLEITVKYRTTKGSPKIEKYNGLTARIIQHEIDHLDGILMVDYNN